MDDSKPGDDLLEELCDKVEQTTFASVEANIVKMKMEKVLKSISRDLSGKTALSTDRVAEALLKKWQPVAFRSDENLLRLILADPKLLDEMVEREAMARISKILDQLAKSLPSSKASTDLVATPKYH